MKQLTLLLVISYSLTMHAGEVFLCKSYTSNGNPKELQHEWQAKTDKICVVYHHDKTYPVSAKYKLSIAKRVEKYFFARFYSQEMEVKKGTNWTATYSKIEEPGDYIISIIDDKGYILGEQNCTIK
ncbi:MAG: hypothetical protein U0T77_11560 [Chitinophagales bacterium]